eukprot:8018961-Pyramimonas_sp.AAC.1
MWSSGAVTPPPEPVERGAGGDSARMSSKGGWGIPPGTARGAGTTAVLVVIVVVVVVVVNGMVEVPSHIWEAMKVDSSLTEG